MKTDQDSLLWRMAVHESGHAVFAAMNGWPIVVAEIRPDKLTTEPGNVEVVFPFGEDAATEQERRSQATYYAAGAAAELLVLGDVMEPGLNGDKQQHSVVSGEAFERSVDAAKAIIPVDNLTRLAKKLECKSKLSHEQIYRELGLAVEWQ